MSAVREEAVEVVPPVDDGTTTRAAGRGGIAVLGAKIFFILSGLLQQAILPLAIGRAETGILTGRVLSIASVVNNVMITSSVQGVSRAVAAAGTERERFVFRDALRLHATIAVILSGLFWLAAPFIARFEEAPYITTPLRILAIVVLLYGLYAPLVGVINGRRQFARQASLDVLFATMRTLGMLLLGYLLWRRMQAGALGASIGFALAAFCIIPLALRWSGTGEASSERILDRRAYLLGLAPLALTQLLTNALMQADITLLGRFLSIGAVTSGLQGAAASKAADEWVAIYRFCQYFAFLPYQLVMSVTQILFPLVARAHAEGDREAVRRYVERGARIAVIASGALVAVVAALPGTVLNFVYGADVAARGADTLRILALGQGAFTMFGIATTVLASLGRERVAAALSFVTLVAVAGGCWFLAASAPFGEAQLQANAVAVSSALAVGLVVAAIVVSKIAGGFVPFSSMARVLVVVGAVVAVGMHIGRLGRLMAPLAAAGIVLSYLIALVVLRELGPDDSRALRAIVDRRRA